MKLITQVKLLPDDTRPLRELMVRFNAAAQYAADVAFQERVFSHRRLRRLVYRTLRDRGCSSAVADLASRKAASLYRRHRDKRAIVRPLGAIPLDRRSFAYKRDGAVSLSIPLGRVRIAFQSRPGVILSHKHEAALVYREGEFYLYQVVVADAPAPCKPEGYLGVDLGVVNIAADSDGKVYSGGCLNGLRKRHARLRQRLQKKGTRAAKRLLRRRHRKEKRFARDVNHCIAKGLVAKALDTGRGIALEELKGIRARIKVRKGQRRSQHSWSFGQLRSFIEYKAALRGVSVVVVSPKWTSVTCPWCGLVDRGNRPTARRFRCLRCGGAGDADIVAAENIRRAASFQPDAAPRVAGGAATQEVGHV